MLWNSITILWNTQANSAFCVVCVHTCKKKQDFAKFKWSHVTETLSKNTVKRKHANSVNLLAMKSGGCKPEPRGDVLITSLCDFQKQRTFTTSRLHWECAAIVEKKCLFMNTVLKPKSSRSRSLSLDRVDCCPPDSVFSTFAWQSHHCHWLNELVCFFYNKDAWGMELVQLQEEATHEKKTF